MRATNPPLAVSILPASDTISVVSTRENTPARMVSTPPTTRLSFDWSFGLAWTLKSWPQYWHTLASHARALPHETQCLILTSSGVTTGEATALPHIPQNLMFAGFSAPHREHFMTVPPDWNRPPQA